MQFEPTPVHKVILAVDIEGYGSGHRRDPERAILRAELRRCVEACLVKAGVPDNQELTDLGDGCLCLLDAATSKVRLIDAIQTELSTSVRKHNRFSSGSARMRLRVVLHAGEVSYDGRGFYGEDLNFAFRLIDSAAARAALMASDSDVMLIVSEYLFRHVVRHDFGPLQSSQFSRLRVTHKETSTDAWYWPGTPDTTTRDGVGESTGERNAERPDQPLCTGAERATCASDVRDARFGPRVRTSVRIQTLSTETLAVANDASGESRQASGDATIDVTLEDVTARDVRIVNRGTSKVDEP